MAAAEANGTPASGEESRTSQDDPGELLIVENEEQKEKADEDAGVVPERDQNGEVEANLKRTLPDLDDEEREGNKENKDSTEPLSKVPRLSDGEDTEPNSPATSPATSGASDKTDIQEEQEITATVKNGPGSHCSISSGSEDESRIHPGSLMALPTRTYSCKICSQSTTSPRKHLYHMKEDHHLDYTIYECDLCDYATQYKQKLPRHRKCHFNDSEPFLETPAAVTSSSSLLQNGGTKQNFTSASMVSILKRPEYSQEQNQPIQLVSSVSNLPAQVSAVPSMVFAQNNGINRRLWDPKMMGHMEPPRKVIKKSPVVREAVDPAKYLAIQEDDGLKFACSKCGNKYKWRKSLNKHWKEKHEGETPPGPNSRFTMLNVPSLQSKMMAQQEKLSPVSETNTPSPNPPRRTPDSNTPDQVLSALKQMAPSVPPVYPYDFSRLQMAAAYHQNLSQYLNLMPSPPKAHHALFNPHLMNLQQNNINVYNAALYYHQLRLSEPDVGNILDLSKKDRLPTPPISSNDSTPKKLEEEPLDFSIKQEEGSIKVEQTTPGKPSGKPPGSREQICFLCLQLVPNLDALNEHFIQKHMATISEQIQNDLLDDMGIERQVDARKFEYLCQYLVRGHISDSITCIVCGKSGTKAAIDDHLYECHQVLSRGVDISTPPARSPEEVDSQDEENRKCNQCGFQARSQTEVERHILVHLLNRQHPCSQCGYSTQSKEELQIHIERFHDRKDIVIPTAQEIKKEMTPDRKVTVRSVSKSPSGGSTGSEISLPYKCNACEYRARWPSEITQHMKNHSDEKPFHCPRCRYRSKWKWDVVKHLKRCGGGTIKDVIDMSKNPVVPVSISQLEVVSRASSIEAASSEEKILDTIQRERSKSPLLKVGTMASKFYCMQCPFVGNSPAELRRHSRVHSDEKPFLCKTCGYRSKWKCDLKKHVRNYNHEPAVSFDLNLTKDNLMRDAATAKNLNAILEQSRSTEVLHRCHQCEYATHKKSTLDAHMRIHQPAGLVKVGNGNTDKYKCKQCDVVSSDLPAFLQHKVSHVDQSPSPLKSLSTLNNPSSLPDMPTGYTNSSMYDHVLPISMPVVKPVRISSYMPGNRDNEVVVVQGVTLKVTRRRNKKVYNCTKCPFTHNNVGNATRHARQHGSRHKHTCTKCDYSVDQRRYLVNHMSTVHQQYINCSSSSEYVQGNNHGEHKGNSSNLSYNNNLSSSHPQLQKLQCKIISRNRNIISVVKRGRKSDRKTFICTRCHFSSRSKRIIVCHKLIHDSKTTKSSVNNSTSNNANRKRCRRHCKLCPYVTSDWNAMRKHKRAHGDQQYFKCTECTFSVSNHDIFESHLSMHTRHIAAAVRKQTLASTDKSTLTFNDVANTTEHGKPALNKIVIQRCLLCPFQTSNKAEFVEHQNCHMIVSELKCVACSYSCNGQVEMNNHVNMHETLGVTQNENINILVNPNPILIKP